MIDQGTVCIRNIILDKLKGWQLGFKQIVIANKHKLKTCKQLFRNQKRLLLSNTQDDIIEECDLTLLILLAGFFNALPNPPCGWYSQKEPDPTDLDPSSDVMRLRFMRNDLYHSVQCAIPQEDFEKRWAKGTEILKRLNARQIAMDKIKPRKFGVVQCKYYVKEIRVMFSSDRPDAEEFVKQRIKEKHFVVTPQLGVNMGNKARCTKCNKQMDTICSDCSSGQTISKPGLSAGEKVRCTECKVCDDCSRCRQCGIKWSNDMETEETRSFEKTGDEHLSGPASPKKPKLC